MLSTISSVRPRVFISAPNADESRQLIPPQRAAPIAPTHFPMTATAISRRQMSHRSQRLSEPTCVLRPVTTKKSGRSTVVTKSSRRRFTSAVRPACRGMIRPIRKAPKIAAIPISREM